MKHDYSNIDKLFKQAAQEVQNTAQVSGNWELLKHLVDASEKRKRWRKKWFITGGISGFLLSLLVFSLWIYQENEVFISQYSSQDKLSVYNYNKEKIEIDGRKDIGKKDKKQTDEHQLTTQSLRKDKVKNESRQHTSANSSLNSNYSADELYSKQQYPIKNTFEINNQSVTGKPSQMSFKPITQSIVVEQDTIIIEKTKLSGNINSEYNDFGAVITADGRYMYFTSQRPTEKKSKKKKKALEHIYKISFDTTGKRWENLELLPEPINLKGRNNSVIGLSNDGQQLFLYRDDENGSGDIFISHLKGKKWNDPEPLPEVINSSYHESSASLSPDGKTLYFVSERPEGEGGKDIWVSIRQSSGKWSKAQNLGKVINTPENEEAVFIHPDGKTLYFSSKGHNSLGGYDIFKSEWKNGKWQKPVNLGKDINTTADELYFVMEANGQTGYYTSTLHNNKKRQDADIFRVEIKPVTCKKKYTARLTLFSGKIIDKQNGNPLEALIKVSDLENNTKITEVKSNSATGEFLVSLPFGINYGIQVTKEGYLFFSENIHIDTGAYQQVTKIIPLERLKKGESIVLKNIFFDYNKATLRKESLSELDHLVALLKKYPEMKIEIAGHTDNKGSSSYNLQLSQQRAQAVVDYLIRCGIVSKRLTAKGYGETRPVAPNANPDGSDNPKGRQLNRRIEFKIIEINTNHENF